MTVKLLTEHNLEFLSLKGYRGRTGSSESAHIKMTHCWKSHVTAHLFQKVNNRGADQTSFVVRKPLKIGFLASRPIL